MTLLWLFLGIFVAAVDAGSFPKVKKIRGARIALAPVQMRDPDEPSDNYLYRKYDSMEFDFDGQYNNRYLLGDQPFEITTNPNKKSIINFIKVLSKMNFDDRENHQEPIHDAEVKITFDTESGVGRVGENDALVVPIP